MPTKKPIDHDTIPQDLDFQKTAHEERHLLETVQVPIVTVSATFREQLYERMGETPPEDLEDVTFSRAHFSMANAIVVAATKKKKTFWLVDPTNYVSAKDWPKILFTQRMGRLIARSPMLKELKDMMDTRTRNKLPLTAAIKAPLEYVFHRTKEPIISLHYESGNILIEKGKKVLQVVTDPHVRPQYVTNAKNKNLFWAVFDTKTKSDLIELAHIEGQSISPDRVFVTGAPTDPRIPLKDKNRSSTGFKHRPLRLAITTGGLGTNKKEIDELLKTCVEPIKNNQIQLALFAGVHPDFSKMFQNFAKKNKIKMGKINDTSAPLRIFYGNDIIDINELLLDHIFPWADGFVTKPSGDMAYEAIAAGCFLLTLEPWGPWEENIRQHFEELEVSKRVNLKKFPQQIKALTHAPIEKGKPWIQLALERARKMQKPLAKNAYNILAVQQKLRKMK